MCVRQAASPQFSTINSVERVPSPDPLPLLGGLGPRHTFCPLTRMSSILGRFVCLPSRSYWQRYLFGLIQACYMTNGINRDCHYWHAGSREEHILTAYHADKRP